MNKINLIYDSRTYLVIRYLSENRKATPFSVYAHVKKLWDFMGKTLSPGSAYNYMDAMIKNNLLRVFAAEGEERTGGFGGDQYQSLLCLTETGEGYYNEKIVDYMIEKIKFPRAELLECLVIIDGDREKEKIFGQMLKLQLIRESEEGMLCEKNNNNKYSKANKSNKDNMAFLNSKSMQEWIKIERERTWKIATTLERQ